MSSRERFFGCTYTVGDREVLERAVRAWDPEEAMEVFSALLRDGEVERPGAIAVRDGMGRIRLRAPYPALRGRKGRARSAPGAAP